MEPSAEISPHQPPINLYDWHRHHYTRFLNLTATKIQSLWRGHDLRLRLARVLWRHMLAYAIQTCWRNYKRRQQVTKDRLHVLKQMDFQLQCEDIKKTVLTMSIEAKQESYVMLKEAVIILKQRYNELLEEK